jgi:hypothetical protein
MLRKYAHICQWVKYLFLKLYFKLLMYFCGIVEDEPLAESILSRYLKRFSFIEIAWECSYAEEAVDLLEKKK